MFTVHEYTASDGHLLRYGKLINPNNPETGRSLLFVPGLGGSVKGALDFLSLLLPYYSPIYGPDLRGFGLNPLETPLFSTDILLRDLEDFSRAVELRDHTALDLCGISLGGVIASLLAAGEPKLFDHLVLLAPAYKAHPKHFTLSYQIRNLVGRTLQGKKHRTTLPYDLSVLTRNEAILNDPQYTEYPPLELTMDFLLSTHGLCARAFQSTGQIQTPTMMVIPGLDVVCDPAAMRRGFARIPATTPKICLEYPELYHDVLFEEEHRDIAEQIRKWAGFNKEPFAAGGAIPAQPGHPAHRDADAQTQPS